MIPLPHLVPMLAENSLFKSIGQIFHPLFIAIADILAFIYAVVPDYTAAIVILTVVIMAVLTPLTIKSTKSMLAMQALQPELQKLKQKYKGPENRTQLNEEMMRLYREHGISPTGGCLPMFLQMPALFVLYDVLEGLANKVTVHGHAVAAPRYIPHDSRMYHDLLAAHGKMHSLGINLALKPLSHHAMWWDYAPYIAFVAVAVGLQYIQMSQMTKRNPGAAQANNQMQKMQKVMPLIFAYIYFIVPVGVAVYMIVSSLIRIITQDLIFRTGVVQRPGERGIPGGAKADQQPRPAGGLAALLGGLGGRARPAALQAPADAPARAAAGAGPRPGPRSGNGSNGAARGRDGTKGTSANGAGTNGAGTNGAGTNGAGVNGARDAGDKGERAPAKRNAPPARQRAGGQGKGAAGSSGQSGKGRGGSGTSAAGDSGATAKPHPRSKAKRARRAR